MPGHDEAVGGHGGEDEHVGAEEADQHVVAPLRPRDHAGVELLENVGFQTGFDTRNRSECCFRSYTIIVNKASSLFPQIALRVIPFPA